MPPERATYNKKLIKTSSFFFFKVLHWIVSIFAHTFLNIIFPFTKFEYFQIMSTYQGETSPLSLCVTMTWICLTLKLPDKLQPYGHYVYYVVHICDFGMLRVKAITTIGLGTRINHYVYVLWLLKHCALETRKQLSFVLKIETKVKGKYNVPGSIWNELLKQWTDYYSEFWTGPCLYKFDKNLLCPIIYNYNVGNFETKLLSIRYMSRSIYR